MKKSLFRECLRIAEDKLPGHPEYKHYPHSAFIIQKNKILSFATNLSVEPPIFFGYHARINHGLPKVHAEYNAYQKAKGIIDPSDSFECLNIRLNRAGNPRLAAPCECCTRFLTSLGCSQCYFTTEIGWGKLIFEPKK
jgi:hypothetical protein